MSEIGMKQWALFVEPRHVESRHLDPEWGFDLDAVHRVHCLRCGEKIGDEPYVCDPIFARFGQMFFLHKRCATEEYMGSEAYRHLVLGK